MTDKINDGGPAFGITCKQCGFASLQWKQFNGKWRLFNFAGNLHSHFPPDLTDITELRQEISRDHWIAVGAAILIAETGTVEGIDIEPAEALYAWLGSYLQDRDLRENTTMNLF